MVKQINYSLIAVLHVATSADLQWVPLDS